MPVPSRASWLCLFALLSAACGTSPPPAADAGAAPAALTDKGPADALPLPDPDQKDRRYLFDDDTWRYVAPPNPGRLYDASYFDGRWFVLHGVLENSGKAVTSESSALSWTQDGATWQTLPLSTEPFESYTRLASNGHSLLLAGIRHVARLEGEQVVPIPRLEQNTAPPVLLPFPGGYALGRFDDIVWLGDDGEVQVALARPLAQIRAGVARPAGSRSLMLGPFESFASTDGKRWSPLASPPCADCALVSLTYGHGRYLAASNVSVYASETGESWQELGFAPAMQEPGESNISRLDFTGAQFVAALAAGNTRLSPDGAAWSKQLKIFLGQVGPAACHGRCYVAAGHLLLPPIPLETPRPPPGADTGSPYYCEYMPPKQGACALCGGATVGNCREGVSCSHPCEHASDCPAADSGNASVGCAQTPIGGQCLLGCEHGETCPDGMTCSGGSCYYVFDDPRCLP